jgi:hypothetical protein
MYTDRNFKTKKALKDAVKAYLEDQMIGPTRGRPVTFYQPNDMGLSPVPQDGNICIEGPHYPEPQRWYASCVAKDGIIVHVK